MPLILKIISYKGQAYLPETQIEFDGKGGSIGRKASNQVVLPSPAVSNFHALIVLKGDQYVLMDGEYEQQNVVLGLKKPSTNGTLIVCRDGNVIRLYGTEAPLHGGERINIGEFELAAEIELATPASWPQSQPMSDNAKPLGPFNPYPTSDQLSPQAFSAPVDLPVAGPEAQYSRGLAEPLNFDFLSAPEANRVGDQLKQASTPAFLPIADETPPKQNLPVDSNAADILRQLVEFYAAGSASAEPPRAAPLSPALLASNPAILSAAAKPTSAEPNLLNAFLEGAGIAEVWPLSPEEQQAAMKTAGALFRNMVAGLMDELQARKAMKEEFRLAHTVLKPRANNPLKFKPDVGSFIKSLLASEDPAFIRANDAVSEGFKDLKMHRLAMTAAFQASLEGHLANFDPQVIERSAADGNPLTKKSRCWALYGQRYPELRNRAIQEIFGEDFADEYEKQMRQLSAD
ncbi:MAG: type VI secretion system-associated FHA domain protein TagH [Methylococcaceae bacterium]|jgi:type VI secretion system protein ImpI/type VI secretion system protein